MNIYRSIERIPFQKNTAITVGTFDGVHLGHREILQHLLQKAAVIKGRSLMITFDPHPGEIVTGVEQNNLLTMLDEKIDLLRYSGLDALFVVNFDKETASISPKMFIENWLVQRIGVSCMIAGYNHAFGKGRGGDDNLLSEFGLKHDFTVDIVEPVKIANLSVSSTAIRQYLKTGDIVMANKMLGRKLQVTGEVVRGNGIGRALGFPTANIELPLHKKLMPKDGVYAVMVEAEYRSYKGMANIGRNPTISGNSYGLEVHIIDFNRDIYGKEINIKFIHRIRSEEKFKTRDDLSIQLEADRQTSLKLLSDQ